MKSRHSSRGPAVVVPYQASLTPPSPRPVVLGVTESDREERVKRR